MLIVYTVGCRLPRVRFKNFATSPLSVPFQQWAHPDGGRIALAMHLEPGEITEQFDPNDPLVQLMLKAHPELRPVVLRNAWERILDGIL